MAVAPSAGSASSALRSHKSMFTDALNDDGLLVTGHGLGARFIMTKFIKLYCTCERLVLILNASDEAAVLRDMLLCEGVPTHALPVVVDADTNANERKRLYGQGKCIIITSRILVVDLLMGRVPREAVSGILVWQAHRITDASVEAFILRLYREKNPDGFIKAFSEDAETLTSGFNRLEKTLRALHVTKLFIWPRFSVQVSEDLAAVTPEVIELVQPLTPLMETIQRAIIECMDACCAELRRSTRIDVDELTLENSLFESFDVAVRRELDPIWPSVRPATKAVIGDLRTLRKLLGYLLRYDAVSFYNFIDMLRVEALQHVTANTSSQWLLSDAGERLFRAARARIYTCRDCGTSASDGADSGGTRSILAAPLEVVDRGDAASAAAGSRRGHSAPRKPQQVSKRVQLQAVLEHNPKWGLLREVLEEIRADTAARPPASTARRILVVLKDERTCRQIRELLITGAEPILQHGFSRFLIKNAARTRKLRAAVLAGYADLDAAADAVLSPEYAEAVKSLPRDEKELWIAAEASPDAAGSAFSGAGGQATRAGGHSDPLQRIAGASVDAASLRQVMEEITAAQAPAVAEETPTGATDPATPALATPTLATPAVPTPSPVVSPAGRPYVLPEQRLLWKAAAQTMEVERQALLAQHAALQAALGLAEDFELLQSLSLAELQATQASASAPTAALQVEEIDLVDDDDAEPISILQDDAVDGAAGARTDDDGAMEEMLVDTFGKQHVRKRKRMAQTSTVSASESPAASGHLQAAGRTGVKESSKAAEARADDGADEVIDISGAGMLPNQATVTASKTKPKSAAEAQPRRRGRVPQNVSLDNVVASSDVHRPRRGRAQQRTATVTEPKRPANALPTAGVELELAEIMDGIQIVCYPLSRMDTRAHLLADYAPEYVVMFDPDPTFTREVEVYQATLARNRKVKVYFMLYGASSEEQKYLSALKKERAAFERLINEKAHMAPAAPAPGADTNAAAAAPATIVRKGAVDAWGITVDGIGATSGRGGGTAGALAALTAPTRRPRAKDVENVRPLTVDIGVEDRGKRRLIVDMREFRAKLPMRLYQIGLDPVPATLEVGDFVLSPEMVVERKSVPDLFGSLNSGRLYTQADAMVRLYKRPILCIEFDEDRPFTLQSSTDMPSDLDISNPVSKMVLLTLHFPTLRILWCRSPSTTATYFAALKQAQDEPDPEEAAAIGTDGVREGSGGQRQSGDAGVAPVPRGEDAAAVESRNFVGMEMLRRLPGVNAVNIRGLMARAGSLHGLATLGEHDLVTIMGAGNGNLLYKFLHDNHASSL